MSGQAPEDKDQRTHDPTGRRVSEFRGRGEVPMSRELSQLAGFAAGGFALMMVLSSAGEATRAMVRDACINPDAALTRALGAGWNAIVQTTMWPMLVTVVAFLVASGMQLGWPPAIRGLKFSLAGLFSVGALSEAFSPKALARRFALSTARLLGALLVATVAAWPQLMRIFKGPSLDAAATLAVMAEAVTDVFVTVLMVLAALAAIDYLHSRRVINARMRMTTEELKQEMKQSEGDPQVKGRRRRKMRELSRRRLVSAVKTADVVLVNPTEYAVAIRYRSDSERAPRVVAKGRNEVAQRIRDLAREAGIPIIAQPPLARLIHKLVPEGREIPSSLYQAVAEVLVYVYRLRRRRSR